VDGSLELETVVGQVVRLAEKVGHGESDVERRVTEVGNLVVDEDQPPPWMRTFLGLKSPWTSEWRLTRTDATTWSRKARPAGVFSAAER
jgi:hypothetical protein